MPAVIDIPSGPTIESDLTAVAFGNQPGRWPLPSAHTPRQLWLRAVGAGGQGRYASARDDLTALLRSAPAGALASLAHSTQASFLRQLGWHQPARGWDGRAIALAGADSEAAADALIGLAADALGVGRLAASATLLSRAEPLVDDAQQRRLSVRRAWVSAELAMAAGDGAAAVRNAELGVELAATTVDGSARHELDHDERERQYADERRDHQEYAFKDVAPHGGRPESKVHDEVRDQRAHCGFAASAA